MPPWSTRQTVSMPLTLWPLQQLVSDDVVKQPPWPSGAQATPPSGRRIVGLPQRSPAGRHAVPLVQRLVVQSALAVRPQQSFVSAQVSPWTRQPSVGWQMVVPVPRLVQANVQHLEPAGSHGSPETPQLVAPLGFTQVPTELPPCLLQISEQQSLLLVQMSFDARQENCGLHAPPRHTPEQQPPPAPASGLHGSPRTLQDPPWPGMDWQVWLQMVVQHSVPEVQALPVAVQVELLQMLLMQLRPPQQSPATWQESPGFLHTDVPQVPLVPPFVSHVAPPQHGVDPVVVEHAVPELAQLPPSSPPSFPPPPLQLQAANENPTTTAMV